MSRSTKWSSGLAFNEDIYGIRVPGAIPAYKHGRQVRQPPPKRYYIGALPIVCAKSNMSINYQFNIGEYLKNVKTITTHNLKIRLFKEKIKEQKCENCNLSEWQGNLIPLELHHIDGNNKNNNLNNLQILCPNCHAITPNYGSKNRKKKLGSQPITETDLVESIKNNYNAHQAFKSLNIKPVPYNYKRLEKIIEKYKISFLEKEKDIPPSKNWRKNPKPNTRKVERPSKEILEQEILTESFSALGRKYGVSDNAVRKWCKYYNISIKK